MIGYLKGQILHVESDSALMLVGDVGYEVLLSARMVEQMRVKDPEDQVSLYIYYHQTERQPRPVLIGFESIEDKEFFQTFITVDAIGPMKAVKAMTRPSGEIAAAIENKDTTFLTGLSGIGKRTAEKIIATLNGKVDKFALASLDHPAEESVAVSSDLLEISQQVEDVLVEQLGHSQASAKRMVKEAFERNNSISAPEELFDEIFREKR